MAPDTDAPPNPTTEAVQNSLEQAKDNVEGRATKSKQDEEFAEAQRREAANQNLTGDAVPEQRPIASQQTIPEIHQSETYRRLQEEGDLPSREPMGREAYEKASSDTQLKKSAKESRSERLIDGTRVLVLKAPYDERPTYGHILRSEFSSPEEEAKAVSGNPALSRFAEVEEYVVRIRGGRAEDIRVAPDEVREVSEADYGRSVV